MIITIASGKGGTGKTTVATNLAASLTDSVQLIDCDVEEPNAHIFLKPEIDERKKAFTMIPNVDLSLCTYCGKCDDICQFSAISQFGEALLTFPEMCHSCEGCMMVCPENAISKGRRELGEVISGNANGIRLTYGSLRVGEAMSPPLIEKVKESIDDSIINILDAPPAYAKQEHIPVLMKIPDKREIAVNYSKGELMVHAFPEMKKEFKALYSDINKRIH